MSDDTAKRDFLVLSRGQWDASLPKETIQRAIDDFYVWYELHLAHGQMKPGHRLKMERRRASSKGVVDGPYAEAKEVIGGYWMIRGNSKQEAIDWAKRCPAGDNEVIELRQVQEFEDFPAEFQAAVRAAAAKG